MEIRIALDEEDFRVLVRGGTVQVEAQNIVQSSSFDRTRTCTGPKGSALAVCLPSLSPAIN